MLLEMLLELNCSLDLFHQADRQTPLMPVITCVASPVAADFVVICAKRESEKTQSVTYVSRVSEALSNAPFGC